MSNYIFISFAAEQFCNHGYDSFLSLVCCFLIIGYLFDSPRQFLIVRLAKRHENVRNEFVVQMTNKFCLHQSKLFYCVDQVEALYENWEVRYRRNTFIIKQAYISMVFLVCLYTLTVLFLGCSSFFGIWNIWVISPPVLAAISMLLIYWFSIVKMKKKFKLCKHELVQMKMRITFGQCFGNDLENLNLRLERFSDNNISSKSEQKEGMPNKEVESESS